MTKLRFGMTKLRFSDTNVNFSHSKISGYIFKFRQRIVRNCIKQLCGILIRIAVSMIDALTVLQYVCFVAHYNIGQMEYALIQFG